MMIKAEIASETSKSRAQTATTGSEVVSLAATGKPGEAGGKFPTSDIVLSFYTNALQMKELQRSEVRWQR